MKRILLDECVPRSFKKQLNGYECSTVPERGWAGKKNGELLLLAEEAGFEVFLALDRGISYQQNLTNRRIAVVLLKSKSSRAADLLPRTPDVVKTLAAIRDGEVAQV